MTKSLFETMQALNDSQIYFTVSNWAFTLSDWAGGIKLTIDDPVYGCDAKVMVMLPGFTEQEIVAWLDKTARELYPDSEYSKKEKQ